MASGTIDVMIAYGMRGVSLSQRVVYVGGLPDGTSDSELRELFGTYGTVARANVIRYKHSGKSAGYGFVELMSGEQALRAVSALEGTLFEGNCLRLFVMLSVSAQA
jgi:RNA recognition motif-containing protein